MGSVGEGTGDDIYSSQAPRMRKSCDLCFQKKKKCDGDGVNPCSFCVVRGLAQCVYCERRPHKYRLVQQQQQQQQHPGAEETDVAEAREVATNKCLLHRQCPTRGYVVKTSIKRFCLSASPATGLVGMKENDFPVDYFRCMGFIPLTCKSVIRQAMVGILLETTQQQQPQQQYHLDVCANRSVIRRNGMIPSPSHAPWGCSSGGWDSQGSPGAAVASRVSTEANKCMFWCAVALGGLVQGRPMELMEGYIQLAAEALEACSGETTEDVARAYSAMAYLNGFGGDHELFIEYLRKADHIAQDLATRGRGRHMPDEFLELVRHADDAKIVHGHPHTPADLRSFCSRRSVPLEISGIITEGDGCRYVMRSNRRFVQAIFSDMIGQGSGEDRDINSSVSGTATQNCRAADADNDAGMGEGETGIRELNPHPDMVPLDAGSSPPSSGDTLTTKPNVRRFLREVIPQVDQLQTLANRPEIRGGIGDLMINGTLVILKAGSDDKNGPMECIERCVEVFVSYPGLCRKARGIHAVHCVTSVLASLKARETYGRLAAAYNVVRPPEAPAMPPMEERLGMANPCDHVFCAAMQRLAESREFGFPPDEEAKDLDCDGGCDGGRVSSVDSPEERETVLTGITDVSSHPASAPVETTVKQMRPRVVLGSRQGYGGPASEVLPAPSTTRLPVKANKGVESEGPEAGHPKTSVTVTVGTDSGTGTAGAAPKEREVEPSLVSASRGTPGGAGAKESPGDSVGVDVGDSVGASSRDAAEQEALGLPVLDGMECDDVIDSCKVALAAPDWLDALDALLPAQTREE